MTVFRELYNQIFNPLKRHLSSDVFSLLKLFYIATAVVSTKVIFLVVPYILNSVEYNTFNKFYYTSGFLIIAGRLGFEFAISRFNIKFSSLAVLVFLNFLFGILFLIVFDVEYNNSTEFLIIVLFSLFYVLANIYLFKTLFCSNHKRYFLEKTIYGFLLFAGILLAHNFHFNIILVFPIAAFIWLLVSYKKENNPNLNSKKEFYKYGLNAFIINSLPAIPIVLDKFIINNFFEISIANSYTFAWALTAPMLYIGNITEQLIFSSSDKNKGKTIKSGFVLSYLAILCYAVLLFVVLSFFNNFLPKSINLDLTTKIIPILFIGYAIFTIIQNPLKAYILKFPSEKVNNVLLKIYPVLGFLFVSLLYFNFVLRKSDNYFLLISIDFVYLYLIIAVQVFALRKYAKV